MSFENPPRPKKVESHQLSDFIELEPEIVKPLESEIIPSEISKEVSQSQALDDEIPFIITEKTIGKISEGKGVDSLGEFRQNIGSLFKKMEGLKAVSGKEVRERVSPSRETPKYSGVLNFQEKEPETISSTIRRGNRGVLNLSSTFGEAETNQPKIVNENEIEKEQSGEPKTHKKPESTAEEIKPADATESLVPSVSKFMELADKAGVGKERSAMQAAEAEYLSTYKEFHKKSGLKRNTEKQNLEKLENAYNMSRVEYARAIASAGTAENIAPSAAFKARMEARYAKMIGEGETPKDYFNKPVTLEKYVELENQRRIESVAKYARYREVIRPAAEKKIEARKEALDAKGQNAFQKGLAWIGEKNQALEKQFGKNGAKGIRILATTAIAGLGAAAVGSFGTASLISIAGWGTYKFGKAFLGSVVGGYAGEIGATAYENFRGKGEQEKAKRNLKGLGKNSEVSLASLKALDTERRKLIGRADERTLETKKNLVKAFIAFGFGAGTSAALADLHAVHAAAGLHVPTHEHAPGSHHEPVVKAPEKPVVSHERFEHQPHASAGHELPPTKPEAAVPAAGSETLTVDAKIDDANKLIGHFAEKLQHDYTGVHPDHVPPAVKTYQGLFETKPGASILQGEDHAGLQLGLRGPHGLSEIMHKGDTISLNKDNQIVINWAEHGRPSAVLIESDGSVHEFNDMLSGPGRMSAEHLSHHAAPHAESHSASETAPHHEAAVQSQSEAHHPAAAQHGHSFRNSNATKTPDTSSDDYESQSQKEVYAFELKNHGLRVHTEITPTPHPEDIVPVHLDTPAITSAPVEPLPVHTPEIQPSTPDHPNMVNFDQHHFGIPSSVDLLTKTPGWDNVKNIRSLDIFTIPANPYDPSALLMQERFLAIVKESGLAPVENQSVEQYIQLATKAIADKASH